MDIFLHTSEQEAEGTLRKIFKAVQKNQARITKRKLLVTRSKNAVTFPKGPTCLGAARRIRMSRQPFKSR